MFPRSRLFRRFPVVKKQKDLLAVKPSKPKKPQVVLSGAPFRQALAKAKLLNLDQPKPGESPEQFWARILALLQQPSRALAAPGMKPLETPPQEQFDNLKPQPLPSPGLDQRT
jgi:hypothetical protein